jgi:aminomethyltransferase
MEFAISPDGPAVEGYEGFRQTVAVSTLDNMAALAVSGNEATALLDAAATGNIEELYEYSARYCLLLTNAGKIISDVIVLKRDDSFLVLMDKKNVAAVREQLATLAGDFGDVAIADVTGESAFIGVDGPYAWELPKVLIGLEAIGIRLLTFQDVEIDGYAATVVRLGFAGEYGYLFITPRDASANLLDRIRKARPDSVFRTGPIPAEIRLEVRSYNCLVDTPHGESPLECGLHWMIDFRKDRFVGLEAIRREVANGLSKKLVALKIPIKRQAKVSKVFCEGQEVGYIVNAAYSPIAKTGMAMAYVDEPLAWVGVTVSLPTDQGLELEATVVSAPFLLAQSNEVEMS